MAALTLGIELALDYFGQYGPALVASMRRSV